MNKIIVVLLLTASLNANADLSSEARWEFDVLLDNKKIGQHEYVVREEKGIQTIATEASFNVKILFVNVFKYRHQNTETWKDDCLISIDAETQANGKDFIVKGEQSESGFRLQREGEELPSSCAKSFSYWNPSFLSATQLLNSQTGKYENVSIEKLGYDKIQVRNELFDAVKYSVSAEAGDITLWYGANDLRWLALESIVKGGRTLRYEATTIPSAFPEHTLFTVPES